jgi:hypothetical protein
LAYIASDLKMNSYSLLILIFLHFVKNSFSPILPQEPAPTE